MIADNRKETYCPFTMNSEGLPKLCIKEKCEAWEPGCPVWDNSDDEACTNYQTENGLCNAEMSFKFCRGFCHRIHNVLELIKINEFQDEKGFF